MTFLYMFLANIEEADKTEESADDITAALTAPRPKNDTHYEEKFRLVFNLYMTII